MRGLSSVATRVEELEHPLLRVHEPERNVLLVVVTADKGLAGAFNSNVIRAATNALRRLQWIAACEYVLHLGQIFIRKGRAADAWVCFYHARRLAFVLGLHVEHGPVGFYVRIKA